ncbi:MAG TPA: PHP domain-containing protein [Victivallales bacterium]|mgnify:CR=1 FL=1|nr:PHP domain-containing protein [Victivallales bacterium]HPO90774.1 PHP domain-containing protein [Victivallales bacterium]HRR05676.1 PHP domain-containing protein [Victivallales bacterium]HRR28831.1 PHP domain-containing protein [Victivallales bacterium]
MIDFHVHTKTSYCADKDLSLDFYSEQISSTNLIEFVCVTDHSMAIYFPEDIAWKWEFLSDSNIFEQWRDFGNQRLAKQISELKKFKERKILCGIETEMLPNGKLCFDPMFRSHLDIVIGSVHFLPIENNRNVLDYWLDHTIMILNSGIDILGHPFRWIATKIPITQKIVETIVKEAKKNSVALELNSHYKYETEDIMMIKICAEHDVKISIASDAHRKEEFGDYSYHMSVIKKSGINNISNLIKN